MTTHQLKSVSNAVPVEYYYQRWTDCLPCKESSTLFRGKANIFIVTSRENDELTVYLAKKALHYFDGKPNIFIVTSRENVFSNCMDVQQLQHLHSSHEQGDTRVILHSLNAARSGATELQYTFSHLIQMCLSSQLDATINSAGTHTSSLVWGTRSV